MSETKKTTEIEVDAAVIDAVAKKATESVQKNITVPTAGEIAEKIVEFTEKTVKKNITEDKGTLDKKTDFAKLSKEMRFAKGVVANLTGNTKVTAEYNSYVINAWKSKLQKANYQNVTTAVDGGALVPDPEFIAEVERLTDVYGVVARLATIRRTDNDSVTLLKGTNEVSFTKVGEATASNAQKLTYSAATKALDKYIATLVLTSEIVEDSAIDMFADATSEIARARAKLFDQLVFTDATYGLLSAASGDTYKTHTVGAALSNFTADDAMDAVYKVVSSARSGGAFFMHPTVWNEIRQTKDSNGAYLFGGPADTVSPVINGYPVELVDILPDSGNITANEAFCVFGDLSRIKLHVKRLLETKVFDSGVVTDAGGTDINLITQDSWAIRSTLRVVPQTRFQGAFTIIGTGTVS